MKACLRYAPMIGARPGELPEGDERELSEHLATCEACQSRLADDRALSGMLSEALLAEASRRDFSTFADGVLARIPAYREKRGEAVSKGALHGFLDWVRHHRAAAVAGALAPALAALALVVYLGRARPDTAAVVVYAEDRGATVLETDEGPVVLLGAGEPEGT